MESKAYPLRGGDKAGLGNLGVSLLGDLGCGFEAGLLRYLTTLAPACLELERDFKSFRFHASIVHA